MIYILIAFILFIVVFNLVLSVMKGGGVKDVNLYMAVGAIIGGLYSSALLMALSS